jgi:putative sigma-54 modulation protein
MHIEFAFKNFEPSEHLKKYARRRLEKTGRFLGKSPALDLQVVLTVDKHRHRAEVKLGGEGLNLTASEQSDDMYASIDLVTDKIESQIRKAAARSHEGRRKSRNATVDVYTYDVLEENGTTVVNGTENFSPKPLHLDEALLQLEQSEAEVLVFFNAGLDRINVLYRKRNGDFALIDPLS